MSTNKNANKLKYAYLVITDFYLKFFVNNQKDYYNLPAIHGKFYSLLFNISKMIVMDDVKNNTCQCNLTSNKSLSYDEKQHLIHKHLVFIDRLGNNVSTNYLELGKAFYEIKTLQLYQVHNNCENWIDFCYSLDDKFHPMVINDLIDIVTTLVKNVDLISEKELSQLTFLQAKKIISCYHAVDKIKTPAIKQKLLDRIKQHYKIQIRKNKKMLNSDEKMQQQEIIPQIDKPEGVLETITPDFTVCFDKEQNVIQVYGENNKLNQLFSTFNDNLATIKKLDKVLISSSSDNNKQKKKLISPVTEKELYNFVNDIPKTELHLHLEGIVTPVSVHNLTSKYNIKYKELYSDLKKTLQSIDDVKKIFKVTSLAEFINLFIFIQKCFKQEEDFALLVSDCRDYMKQNNIRYAEIHFAPTAFIKNGFSYEILIEILGATINKIRIEDGIDIRILMDVSRTYGPENAMRNLDNILKYHRDWVLGIGLGGNEETGPASDYVDVFEKAIANGLHVVAHAGEDVGPHSIWDAILKLKAQRIGHGISAIQDRKLMDYLKEHQIPLEVCPTSNVFTQKYVNKLSEHPIREFYNDGLLVTLNTDDPTIFNISLTDEYMNLVKYLNFSLEDIIQLIYSNANATFLSKNDKKLYTEELTKKIDLLLKKYNFNKRKTLTS